MATQVKFDLTQLNGTWVGNSEYVVEIPAGIVIESGGSENPSKSETIFFTISPTPPKFLSNDIQYNVDSTKITAPSLPTYSIVNTGTYRIYEISSGGLFPTAGDTLMASMPVVGCYFGTTSTSNKGITNFNIPLNRLGNPDVVNYFKQGLTYYLTSDAGALLNGYATTSSIAVTSSTVNLFKFTWDKAIVNMKNTTFTVNKGSRIFFNDPPYIGLSSALNPYTIQFSTSHGEFGTDIAGSDRSSNWTMTSTDITSLNSAISNLRFWPTENITSGTFTYTQMYNSSTVATITKNLTGYTQAYSSATIFYEITSSTTWTVPNYDYVKYSSIWNASAIIVGGGGSGRYNFNPDVIVYGGGGAGGVAVLNTFSFTQTSYEIVIGAGGAGTDGGNSSAFGTTAYGGQAGDRYDVRGGNSGAPTNNLGWANYAKGTGTGYRPGISPTINTYYSGGGAGGRATNAGIGGTTISPQGFLDKVYGKGGDVITTMTNYSYHLTVHGSGGPGQQPFTPYIAYPGKEGIVVIKVTK